jgi:hypothetical protein
MAMPEPAFEFLFELTGLLSPERQAIGQLPTGYSRSIVLVEGGRFQGPALEGDVLPGGGDWVRVRADGAVELDVRITLRTSDGALIYMSYPGLLHNQPIAADGRTASGRYFRTTPRFETSDERYSWLNRILAVGVGQDAEPGQVRYNVYAVM